MLNKAILLGLLIILSITAVAVPVLADHGATGVAVTIQARASEADIFDDEIWLDLSGLEMISPATPPSIITECQQLGHLVPVYTGKVLADASNSLPMDGSFDWRQGWRVEIKGIFKPAPSCQIIASHGDSAKNLGPWSNTPPPSGNQTPSVRLLFGQNDAPKRTTDTFYTDAPIVVLADASDPDGDELSYEWFLNGEPQPVNAATVDWAEPVAGRYTFRVQVSDGRGGVADASATIVVDDRDRAKLKLRVSKGKATVNGEEIGKDQILVLDLDEAEIVLRSGTVIQLEADCLQKIIVLFRLTVAEDFVRFVNLEDPDALGEGFQGAAGVVLGFIQAVTELLCERPSSPLNLFPQSEPVFDQFFIALQGGAISLRVEQPDLNIGLFNENTSVRSQGMAQYSVAYNPDEAITLVAAHNGFVRMFPSDALPLTLQPGKMVTIENDVVSAPSDAPPAPDFGDSTPAPSPSADSIAAALDANRNGVLDESEVRMGIQYWIMGETVPGSGETISDSMMRNLIQMWILGTAIAQSAQAQTVQPLSVSEIRMAALSPLLREVWLSGEGIAATQVQVYDLSGQLLIERRQPGRALNFNLLDASGRPLANGVYLMLVSATGLSGERWRSEVKKMLLLR